MLRSVIIFVIIFTFSSWGCSKDEDSYSLDYPFVIMDTNPVVSSGSIDLTARLLQKTEEEILSYGFVWNTQKSPMVDKMNFLNHGSILFQGSINGETYSHTINTESLDSDSLYYVRAYLITTLYEIYSNTYSFRKK